MYSCHSSTQLLHNHGFALRMRFVLHPGNGRILFGRLHSNGSMIQFIVAAPHLNGSLLNIP